MTRTRTEITIETERVLVVNQRRRSPSLWCNQCAKALRMLTLDELVAITGITAKAVFELAKAGSIHLASTAGEFGVCPNSPALRADERNP